jgi:hypothetical protein
MKNIKLTETRVQTIRKILPDIAGDENNVNHIYKKCFRKIEKVLHFPWITEHM